MKYKLPDGCAGVTLAGVAMIVASDRTVTASVAAGRELAAHGIVPAPTAAPVPKPGGAPR